MSDPQWTVGRVLDWTTGHLRTHGSETPRLEAEILLAHVRGCPRIQLYVNYAEPLSDAQRAAMRELVRRRVKHEPVAYLVGRREFFGLEFRVTPAVLVPRPETETLVLDLVTAAKKKPTARILDVGTGSGCIAIAAAVNLPQASVTAIDISPQALAVARENASKHKVAERLRWLEGDLLAPLPPGEQFEFIVSNPPYITDAEMETLAPDVRLHEPALALRGGKTGLDLIARLIRGAADHLVAGGTLLIEIDPAQQQAVQSLFVDANCYELPVSLKDAAGEKRVVCARRKD
jgi:release factor glutamine methyltransferase